MSFVLLAVAGLAALSACGGSDDGDSAAAIEPDRPTNASLTQAEEDELVSSDKQILIYCTKDRASFPEVKFVRAADYIGNLALLKPSAEYRQATKPAAGNPPTVEQHLRNQVALIKAKCEGSSVAGSDQVWKEELKNLQTTARQLDNMGQS